MSHETQIVLDLPDEVAELLEADPPPHMEIRWDPLPDGAPVPPPCGETARFCVAGHEFFAKLMSLPTVVESKKSVDPAGEVYYESRKIGQVLVVAKSREELPAGTEQRDGLTPPMAAIRERKWRRRPLHDPKAVEQVALELERGLRGGGPLKPEYDMVDEEDSPGRGCERRPSIAAAVNRWTRRSRCLPSKPKIPSRERKPMAWKRVSAKINTQCVPSSSPFQYLLSSLDNDIPGIASYVVNGIHAGSSSLN